MVGREGPNRNHYEIYFPFGFGAAGLPAGAFAGLATGAPAGLAAGDAVVAGAF
jgi:hypothetical protein